MGERFCEIRLRVNGEDVTERVEARKTLVDFLRDDLGLTGSHIGCEQGGLRRLHGAARRGGGARLPGARGAMRRRRRRNHRGTIGLRRDFRSAGGVPAPKRIAMRLLHARHADRGARTARPRHCAEPRRHPRAYLRQLLSLHRLSGYCGCNRGNSIGPRRSAGEKGRLTMNEHANPQTLSAQADELEERMMHELGERIATKSVLFRMADGKVEMENGAALKAANPDKYFLMGADARLPKMPKKPTLIDFFNNRFASLNHLLQSATHALKGGHSEKVVLACLLHDIGVAGFIRCDHGYWGAQMIEPYVSEEVSWAVRAHQALRFFPDPSVGYEYPEMYIRYFGADYKPEPYIVAEYERAKNHKYYMTSRLITVNDIYSFDPNAKVDLNDFVDIIGRNFKQPEEGLGFDNSPSAHMWRTLMWPTRFL